MPFVVTVAETTNARRELTRAILMRSGLRLALMIAGRRDRLDRGQRALARFTGWRRNRRTQP